jgi:hypothetical protein
MNSTLLVHEPHTVEHPPLIIERFLRDREGVWRQIKLEYQLNALIVQMLTSSTIALACYGMVMGISSGHPLQSLSAAIKLPVLFLLTLAICLPTLYLFNLLGGGRLSARQALALVLAAITVTASLTVAFAPIALFFMITARSYPFFILLNTAIMSLTGAIGVSFLITGVQSMNAQSLADLAALPPAEPQDEAGQDAPKARFSPPRPRPVNMTLLPGWVVLFGFVGTQLAWTLRPFMGDPDKPFILFRPIESNFYIGVIHTIAQLFQGT